MLFKTYIKCTAIAIYRNYSFSARQSAFKGVSLESFYHTRGIPYESFWKSYGNYHRTVVQSYNTSGKGVWQSDTLIGMANRYFKKFDTHLFAYMKDGRYTIDNLIAERAIRSFTVERNNAPTFCRHKGVEISAQYHTVIETCKLQGYSVLDYLEAFFSAVIKGWTDYENLMPATLGISRVK